MTLSMSTALSPGIFGIIEHQQEVLDSASSKVSPIVHTTLTVPECSHEQVAGEEELAP